MADTKATTDLIGQSLGLLDNPIAMRMILPIALFLVSLVVTPSQASADSLSVLDWFVQGVVERSLAEIAAAYADEKICFSDIDSLNVSVLLNETAKQVLSEQRAKDKFQLTLRRYDVPLSDSTSSLLYLVFSIEAVRDEKWWLTAYSVRASLYERLVLYRNEIPYKRLVELWHSGDFGFAGSDVIERALLESIEKNAERIANLYLSANP
ncbi:MAG: hypothetical protein F4Y91_05915 [Gemmatimonadetes bacterium]|nr:hypothetical protein [Gemmatimonadota bacterium]MXY81598.1 hypothetical protein [Gemmatimonadota bacterium]MYB71764.1 hypothetical protein [Gemmatimonadota bacterium]